jgi:hypothetical protein
MSEPFLYFELSTGAGAAEPGVGATTGTDVFVAAGATTVETFEEALEVIIRAELELHSISRTIPPITRGIFDEAAFAGMFDIYIYDIKLFSSFLSLIII